jgi:Mrp family chromosome partitioning ATPase
MENKMSEIDQAFLRAYLKNRTSQSNEAGKSGTTGTTSHSTPTDVPSPTSTSKHLRSAATNEMLRVDQSHAPKQTVPSQQSIATPVRQGVWSPIGVERGMKAMESRASAPAIVTNGVQAVSPEATQRRVPVSSPQPAPSPSIKQRQPPLNLKPHSQAPVTATVAQTAAPTTAPTSNAEMARTSHQYDQVQYVDGLSGHALAAPHSHKPSEHTLAEIAEPIAFGTGIAAVSRRQSAAPEQEQGTTEAKVPSDRAASKQAASTEMPIHQRIDALHRTSAHAALLPKTERIPIPVQSTAPIETKKTPTLPLPVAFAPSWEVDCFFWPDVVKQIERSHADAFLQIGKHLSLANRDGLKVMSITSGERGVGRSTVAMHMARCAASSGLNVALIDGDTFCPSLMDQLRLDVSHGWQDCLFENVPLHEVAVHSIQDHVTLFPLTTVISPQEMHANLHRIAKLIKRISTAFDIVFIDANRLNLEQRDMVGVAQESIVDAAIVVVDTELSIKEKVDSAVSILQGMGLSSIGLVENFQS